MKTKPEKIYIAGPYSADTEKGRERNTYKALDVGVQVMTKGHIPFIPHLYHWLDKRAKKQAIEFTYQDWMDLDDKWLQECDALLYLAKSPGADVELKRAISLGIKVYYSVDAIPDLGLEIENEIHRMIKTDEEKALDFPPAHMPRQLICDMCRKPIELGQTFVVDKDYLGEHVFVHAPEYADWVRRQEEVDSGARYVG